MRDPARIPDSAAVRSLSVTAEILKIVALMFEGRSSDGQTHELEMNVSQLYKHKAKLFEIQSRDEPG